MKVLRNEDGYVLVVALLILAVLSIIGAAATNTSIYELLIAGNDRVQKRALYQAESNVILATNVIEENINCPVGFGQTATVTDPFDTDSSINVADLDGYVRIYGRGLGGLAIYYEDYPTVELDGDIVDDAGNLRGPDFGYPISDLGSTVGTGEEETAVYVGGGAKMLPGGALQMIAGYEGKGKGSAGGGTQRDYLLIAKHFGQKNAQSIVSVGWRHIIGTEDNDCLYE